MKKAEQNGNNLKLNILSLFGSQEEVEDEEDDDEKKMVSNSSKETKYPSNDHLNLACNQIKWLIDSKINKVVFCMCVCSGLRSIGIN